METVIMVFTLTFLMGMLIISVQKMIVKAQVVKAVEDFRVIADAATRYHQDTGQWPWWGISADKSLWGMGFTKNNGGGSDGTPAPIARWDGPYLESWIAHPWSKEATDSTMYQWDDTIKCFRNSVRCYMVEMSMSYMAQTRRNYIANLIDRAIDNSDGPCNGTFRGDPSYNVGNGVCKDWSGWPFYWVANGSTVDNDLIDKDPNPRRDF